MDAMDAGRQLYGYTAVYWDHSPNTYASSYLAMITGFIAAGLTWQKWSGLKGEMFGLCTQTICACLFQGVGFGMAGIAFHIVDTRAERGQTVGTDLWGQNSGWIFPWFFSVVFKPLCSSCILGSVAAYVGTTSARFTAVRVANGLGLLVAIIQAYFVVTDQIWSTAKPEFYFGMFVSGVCAGAVLIVGWTQVSKWWLFAGLALRFVGHLYVVFGSCAVSYSAYDTYQQAECGLLQDATKNLVYNICCAFSVIPFFWGVVKKSAQDHDYQQLLKAEAAAKAAKENEGKGGRSCCSGLSGCASGS